MPRRVLYFFPVQLVIHHLKRNHTLLLPWFVLFGIVTGDLGSFLGLRYLFLVPEYLGVVGFRSFLITGVALGIFTMIFHSTTYIIDIHRFPFIGTLSRPFMKLCLNNSIIPISFLGVYIVNSAQFQRIEQESTLWAISINIMGLLVGFMAMSWIVLSYMTATDEDSPTTTATQHTENTSDAPLEKPSCTFAKRNFEVASYLETPWRLHYTARLKVDHDPSATTRRLVQHGRHLIFLKMVTVTSLCFLGLFWHHTMAQIPAAASGILFLAILMTFAGLLSSWMGNWTTTATITLIAMINVLSEHGITLGTQPSQALGMDYASEKAIYSLKQFKKVNCEENYLKDQHNTLQILNNWRKKFPAERAPQLVIICASGGGQKAALWTLHTLQTADSATRGDLMKHTMLMSCVSGGALGGSYFRELCLRHGMGEAVDPYDPQHLEKIAQNNLNPIVFNFLTNDILLDINTCQYRGMTYRRDRGYALEEQVNQCTDYILDKSLHDYQMPEFESKIPMLFLVPIISHDGSKLFISPQGATYMGTTLHDKHGGGGQNNTTQGIDLMHFFGAQGASNLRFLSALRMAAAFPYVLPGVALPSTPVVEAIDGGIFDNFGVLDALRFVHVFKDWITENTSGVILVTIKSSDRAHEVHTERSMSLSNKYSQPISDFQTAWINVQDVRNSHWIQFINDTMGMHRIEVIEFQYTPTHTKQRDAHYESTSLSWHLTKKEKQRITQSIYMPANQKALARLKSMLMQ